MVITPNFNCKQELILKWIKYCALSGGGNDNANADDQSDHIIFDIKDTKMHFTIVTLSAKDNRKLSKVLSKGFKRSIYWNEYKKKRESKNTFKSIFLIIFS